MNYQRIYNEMIQNAKQRNITGYTETHHILPKSMGGSDDENNLVRLTAREHYIAHWLLTKFVPEENRRSMNYALWLMSQDKSSSAKGYRITSRQFEYNRKQHSIMKAGSNNPQFGKPSWISGKTKENCDIVARIAESKVGDKKLMGVTLNSFTSFPLSIRLPPLEMNLLFYIGFRPGLRLPTGISQRHN